MEWHMGKQWQWGRSGSTTATLLATWMLASAFAWGQEVTGCAAVGRASIGPFDYRLAIGSSDGANGAESRMLKLTEQDHFTPVTESLRRGHSNITAGPDIAYTLRIFPNHYRALLAMVALGEREKTNQPQGSPVSVECWLLRAIAFRSDDNLSRLIYTKYLIKAHREADAVRELDNTALQAGDNPFTQHNIGLLYFDLKNYAAALKHAHRAYGLGLATPTLRDQLKAAGQWAEPAP